MAPRSHVWRHFLKKAQYAVMCKHCTKVLSYSGRTASLWRHLKIMHGIKASDGITSAKNALNIKGSSELLSAEQSSSGSNIPQALPPKRPCIINEPRERASAFSNRGERAEELNDALVFMVCRDHIPICTPEREGFRYFAKKAMPSWEPPSRQTLTIMIEKKFDVQKSAVMAKISKARNYTITAEVWTDFNTLESYLGLTVHYLWGKKIESRTFGVEPLTHPHVSAHFPERIQKLCREWNIDMMKVSTVVSYTTDNIEKAIKDLFNPSKHIPCFAHILNLIPHAAMGLNSKKEENVPGVLRLISKVQDIMRFFKRNVKASHELHQLRYANDETEGEALGLSQDVSTSWHSTYLILQQFLTLSGSVGSALLKYPESPSMLSDAELASVRVIAQILAPIMQATVELSAEKTSMTSKIIPVTYLMRRMITMTEPARNDRVSNRLKDFVIAELDQRFGKAEQMKQLAMATMLDPRYKKLHFQSQNARSQTIKSLNVAVEEVIRGRSAQTTAMNIVIPPVGTDPTDMWSLHNSLLSANFSPKAETDGGILMELRKFLDSPVVDPQMDPFEAWDALKAEYPHVYEVALDYLPNLATSVPSERLFSEAGLIATQLRNRLTGSHLSKLLFLASVNEEQWSST